MRGLLHAVRQHGHWNCSGGRDHVFTWTHGSGANFFSSLEPLPADAGMPRLFSPRSSSRSSAKAPIVAGKPPRSWLHPRSSTSSLVMPAPNDGVR